MCRIWICIVLFMFIETIGNLFLSLSSFLEQQEQLITTQSSPICQRFSAAQILTQIKENTQSVYN